MTEGGGTGFNTGMRSVPVMFLMLVLLASCGKQEVRPEESAFDPEEAFREANVQLGKKNYEEARDKLDEIRVKDAGGEFAPLAELRMADSYTKEEEYELAVSEYQRFLGNYPRHKYSSYAQYQIARSYYHRIGDPERSLDMAQKAVEEFRRLNRLYPRNPYRDTVAFNIQRSLEILADHEFVVGRFYYRKKSYTGALNRFLGLLERFPDYRAEAKVLAHIAVCYERLGESEKAEEYLHILEGKYPGQTVEDLL